MGFLRVAVLLSSDGISFVCCFRISHLYMLCDVM